MIQVAATVTESSVSTKLPLEQATGSAPEPVRATPPPRPAVPSPLAPDALESEPNGDDGATVIRRSPFFLEEKSSGGGAPRPPRATPGAPRIVPPARASLRSSAPPPRPSSGGAAAAAAMPMHSPSSPGLHAGFVRAVASAPAPESSQPLPTEDWYVGIGGVPLGPVRLAVLRDKAAAGQVDGESLVWREGFDEWQSIRSIPPLHTVVEEAKQTRASRMSLPAVVAPTPRPSSVSLPAATAAAPPSPFVPAAAPSLPFDLVRNSGVPAVAGATGAGAMGPGAVGPGATGPGLAPLAPFSADPGATKDPFAPSGLAPLTPPPGMGNGTSTNGYGLTTTAGLTSSGPSPSIAPAPISDLSPTSLTPEKKRRGLPPAAWALIAMAAAFGGVAAWALFLRQPATPVASQTPTAQATDAAPLGGASPPPPPSASGEQVAEPGATIILEPGKAGTGRTSGGGTTPTPGKTSEPGAGIDKTGFQPTPGGPSAADPPTGSGGALTEGEINGVVSRNKPMITRRCWLPAYDARGPSAPSSAKVSVTLKVGPTGSVSSASAGGSETHYPGLASCIAGSVKAWQFPPSDEGATINIPFSFSGQ
jgi:hypothetical protein